MGRISVMDSVENVVWKMSGGIPVRDDGAILHTTQSKYEWR